MKVAAELIRKWVNEESDSDDGTSRDSDSESDSVRRVARNADIDSGSEVEDCIPEDVAEQQESSSGDEHSEVAVDSDDSPDDDVSEDEDEEASGSSDDFISRSGMTWNCAVPPPSKTKRANIVREPAGPSIAARNQTDPVDIFRMFLTPEIMSRVLEFTNAEGRRRAEAKQLPPEDWKPVTKEELDVVVGLLYMCGIFGMSKVSLRRIWTRTPVQNPIFPAVMSGMRFAEILSLLRFDDKDTREARRAVDKFAPIRDVWDSFAEQCRTMYNPSAYLTVDEQLLGFRGRCPFRQYIKSKPDRYGIKLWLCADAETYYVSNIMPYLGREDRNNAKTCALGTEVVVKLLQPLENSGRNVTCDNFFTNVQLADMLYDKKLTLLGTMRKSNRDVPNEFFASKSREVGSSLFAFSASKTLVSYVPKRNRAVVLLSTMHNDDKLDDKTKKPEIIMEYNRTKGGVDSVDQLCHKYTVKRPTRRWPMCVFYGILDIAAVNTFIVFLHNNPDFHPKVTCKRRIFLESLAMDLMKPQLEYRRENPAGLGDHTRTAMSTVGYPVVCLPKPARPRTTRAAALKRKRCHYCPVSKDRKVFTECDVCHNRVCPEHGETTSKTVCIDCL